MRITIAPLPLLVLLLAGCNSEYPLAPVAGQVTLDGQPLVGATIGFEPVRKGDNLNAGPGSYGRTDDQGRYSLTSLDDDNGAVVGNHRVWIRTLSAEEGPNGGVVITRPEILPPKYHDQTELVCEVPPEGRDNADFALTLD